MPRAATKTELITTANDGWDKLWKRIDALPDAGTVAFDFGDDPKLNEAHWKRDITRAMFSFIYMSGISC